MQLTSRTTWLFILIAVVGAFILTRGIVVRPTYTDAYYHFNGALRLAEGEGFTEDYLWVYVGNPDTLPAPSHRYWMPFTSIIASISMVIFDSTDYAIAQLPFMLMFAGTILVGYWLGGRIGGTMRHRWQAGLFTLFSGFFVRWWGEIDTFAPYAISGALCLVFIGLAVHAKTKPQHRIRFWFLAGLCAGFGHLTRVDGLLLLIVGWAVLLLPWAKIGVQLTVSNLNKRLGQGAIFTLGYLLVMTPWFVHNLDTIGAILPAGGTESMWFDEYNDLFNYPAGATPDSLFADGADPFIEARLTALANNLGTFIAVEGLIIMCPLMLLGLWNRRRNPFFLGFWVYVIGLHVVMTFVFPFAGYRGGLFHSASALVPWWAILGLMGLDDLVDWIGKRRESWTPERSKPVFSMGLLLLAVILSFQFGLSRIDFSRTAGGTPRLYRALTELVPDDARIMINDPSALYYFTQLGGVVTPNALPEVIPEIAERYDVSYLLVEFKERDDGEIGIAIPEQLRFDLDNPPSFLTEIPIEVSSARLYAITNQ